TSVVKCTILSREPGDNSALMAIASVSVLLFLSILGWQEGKSYYGVFAAIPERVFRNGEYWRLFTAIGIHADMKHFLSNAVFFGFFAYLLYGYFGFLIFPTLMLLLGGLVNYLSLLTYSEGVRLVGASGLVYLMAGFWLVMYVLIERRFPLKKRLLRSVGVGLVVFMPTTLQPFVSYRTHAIGFFVGVAAAITCFLVLKKRIRSAEVMEIEEVEETTIM
ncbi:MAG: rhomboid family intramembrane serine protease, partial [bacterium]